MEIWNSDATILNTMPVNAILRIQKIFFVYEKLYLGER